MALRNNYVNNSANSALLCVLCVPFALFIDGHCTSTCQRATNDSTQGHTIESGKLSLLRKKDTRGCC